METLRYCCDLIYHAFLLFPDVAFEVGGDSGVNYLVLQVHYGKVDNFKGEIIKGLFPSILPDHERLPFQRD